MPEKRKKLTGIDIYICINNINEKEYLTIGRPYRIIQICRDNYNEILFMIKNNKNEINWYNNSLFKIRNKQDDRGRNSNE
jgi:hypothetical protein